MIDSRIKELPPLQELFDSMNILNSLRQKFATVLDKYEQDTDSLVEQIRPSGNPKFGDYQANLAMPLAKKLGRKAPELAQEIVDSLDVSDICDPPEVAGNGFINLRLKTDWINEQLQANLQDTRLGVATVASPRKYVIDYSSPNVAKPMHVGHIRSTVIGDAVSRTLRFLGHDVITDNHLGDWGTQFGMIIYGYKHFVDADAYQSDAIGELSRIYRLVRKLMDYHAGRAGLSEMNKTVEQLDASAKELENQIESAEKAEAKKLKKERNRTIEKRRELVDKINSTEELIQSVEQDAQLSELASQHDTISAAVLDETVRLHENDEENVSLWKKFLPHCMEDLHRIYDKLGVGFDHEHGESFYHDMLPSVVNELTSQGFATESDGAMCIFLDEFDTPMLIQKKDGAFLYATSDLATVRYRMQEWKPDIVLYVVDHRQHEHFEKLFAAARLWGYDDVQLVHVAFGTVMGDDGKPFRTRSGDIVGLEGLVDEAVSRAYVVVSENAEHASIEMDEATRKQIASVVGIGALKYADLSQNRSTDYKFSYDNMLALKGNTGPYLQYSYARNQGIFARGEVNLDELRKDSDALILDSPEERALALSLLRLEEALHEVTVDYRPNLLCNYVYQVSTQYSVFFNECPVLKAENEALRVSRLKLCDLTSRTVKLCLELLGIDVIERM